MNKILCYHGCGNEAVHFTKKHSRPVCNSMSQKCPAVRIKNSKAIQKAHKDGVVPGWSELRNKYNVDTGKGNRGKFTRPKSSLISKRGHKCEGCDLTEWLGKPITLELEHIDGNNRNNDESNLKLLCPNCHSQTSTWRRKKSKNMFHKHPIDFYVEAIKTSTTMSECLRKLDLRWGSNTTILKIMEKHNLSFMRC